VLTAIVAYVTLKSRIPGAWLLDVLVSLPIAVPSILMGVGILFWYLVAPLPFHLYGTLTILIVGFVTIGIPYGMRYASSGLAQIRDELEEAATVSGASWTERFLRIYVPLLMPSLMAAFLTTVIIAFREISAAIFLYSQGTEVVSIAIFDLWSNGQYPAIAALGCVLVVLLLGLVALVQRLGGRIGIGAQ
jgi:iron(III) transport system permease protein